MKDKIQRSFLCGLLEACDECLATALLNMRADDVDYPFLAETQMKIHNLLRSWKESL